MFPDHLGKAAIAKHAAIAAERAGDNDQAWRLYQECLQHYMGQAAAQGFTAEQTHALAGCVYEWQANLLRKEGRHLDAFVAILYWVIAQKRSPIKSHEQKLRAYFNRSGIKMVTLAQVQTFVRRTAPDYVAIRDAVGAWAGR